MNRSIRNALATLLALVPALMANPPRLPHGIYAVVNVDEYLKEYQKVYDTAAPADYFSSTVYPGLLANTAVSGITLYETWAMLNPNDPNTPYPRPKGFFPYDWSFIQDLFDQVAKWNTDNPAKTPKTVQLVVTPGFNSPLWLKDQINSCNFLFDPKFPSSRRWRVRDGDLFRFQ